MVAPDDETSTGYAKRLSRVAVLGAVLTVLLAGCLGQTPNSAESTSSTELTSHADLASPLYRLATAERPERFAETHDIRYRNGSAKVRIELAAGTSLPSGYGLDVETKHEDEIVAWCPVDELTAIAAHENTTAVRQPMTAQTYGQKR